MLNTSKKRKAEEQITRSVQKKSRVNDAGDYIVLSPDDNLAEQFFRDVVKSFGVCEPIQDLGLIVVTHVVSTLPYYLKGLEQIGRIAAIVPKTNKDERIEKYLEEHDEEYPFCDIPRDDISAHPQKMLDTLREKFVYEHEKIIIIDIGGYFASCIENFYEDEWWRSRLIGIVEDTENGHQDYERLEYFRFL